jgi:hypothetical protein
MKNINCIGFLLIIVLLLLSSIAYSETKLQNQTDPTTGKPTGEWVQYLIWTDVHITV